MMLLEHIGLFSASQSMFVAVSPSAVVTSVVAETVAKHTPDNSGKSRNWAWKQYDPKPDGKAHGYDADKLYPPFHALVLRFITWPVNREVYG